MSIDRKSFRISFVVVFIAFLVFSYLPKVSSAPPRVYGTQAAVTNTNQTLSIPFNPIKLCLTNIGISGVDSIAHVDFTDGVATTSIGSTNVQIPLTGTNGSPIPHCFDFHSQNVTDTMSVGLITSVGTTSVIVHAWSAR